MFGQSICGTQEHSNSVRLRPVRTCL
uniref:Uncharacterized protein n=1 Tax=Anguilla anguilla TaxID=7936 RepID=A0A0E9QU70_ANGAN